MRGVCRLHTHNITQAASQAGGREECDRGVVDHWYSVLSCSMWSISMTALCGFVLMEPILIFIIVGQRDRYDDA